MKIITNITGTASDSAQQLTQPIPRPKQPGDLYRQFYDQGIVFADAQKNQVLFPWSELEKAAKAAVTPP
jgi:hypothetical protein